MSIDARYLFFKVKTFSLKGFYGILKTGHLFIPDMDTPLIDEEEVLPVRLAPASIFACADSILSQRRINTRDDGPQ